MSCFTSFNKLIEDHSDDKDRPRLQVDTHEEYSKV